MSYINHAAKEEAQRQSRDQIGAVQEKLKKWADKVVVGGFYKKAEEAREEGEVWKDVDGKEWTVKHGIKQNVTRLQDAKMPWWCPSCGRVMNHKIHEKFYWLKSACHDCWIKYEGQMRIEGVYSAYERRMLRANERAWIADIISQHLDYIQNQNDMELHFMDGRWEVLAHASEFDQVKEKLQNDIQFMYDRLEVIEKEEIEDAEHISELENWERENPWRS